MQVGGVYEKNIYTYVDTAYGERQQKIYLRIWTDLGLC